MAQRHQVKGLFSLQQCFQTLNQSSFLSTLISHLEQPRVDVRVMEDLIRNNATLVTPATYSVLMSAYAKLNDLPGTNHGVCECYTECGSGAERWLLRPIAMIRR